MKHILVATDGSKLSAKAVTTAARLAKTLHARLTGLYVIAPYVAPYYTEGSLYAAGYSLEEYKRDSEKAAKSALAAVQAAAKSAGVACTAQFVSQSEPWKAIISAAKSRKCGLVVMASHGRRGLSSLLLGSETTKVLTHSKIPVLVCR